MTKKCICQICTCGRHRCPHEGASPNRVVNKSNQDRCHVNSEYKTNYLSGQRTRGPFHRPTDLLQTEGDIDKDTTQKVDYVPFVVKPPKPKEPEKYVPNPNPFETVSEHRDHYRGIRTISPDHTQGVHVDSHTIQRNEFIGSGCINQPGKRKRQCFQPPILSHSRPALTQSIQPEAKKKKEDNIIPQQNVRLAAVKSSSSKHDFFNLYKAYSGKQERETNSPCYQNESSLQAQDVHAPHCFWPTGQQQDQRVPFSITGPSSVAEKENQRPSNQVFTESRRSTAQILALFSSSKNTPRLQNTDVKESTGAFHSSISDSGRFHMHRLQRYGSMDEELKDTVKFSSCVNSLARATYVAQPNFRENDSNESKLTVSGDVCESVNVSPDSLTACSSQTTCTLFDGDRGPQGNHAPSRAEAQEPAGGNEKQNKRWLQTGSETVPPVMRHPVGGDRDHPQVGVDLVEERCWPSDGVTQDGSKLDHCKSESLDSAHFNETPAVTQSCHNLCLTRSLQGFQASTVTCSDADLVQASPLAEPNLTFRRPHTDSLYIKDVFTGYKYIPETRHGKSAVSSHPGSLFPYSALDRQNQTMALEGLSKLKPWNRPYFDSKCAQDVDDSLLQSRLSPELYAPEKDKLTQRRAAAVGTTKVIPSDSRTVKAGDGHLWTGSVVSDTVKRESPSLPMVSVLRSQLHNQPRHVFSGDESDPLEGFATSESIALSSTEGFINQNKVAEQTCFQIHTEFVQRVPQLATRRTPILTAPFETRDDISTETCFTVCHETAAAASVTEVAGVCAGSSGLCDGGKEKHSEQSLLRGSCGRIGLRRVGLGSSRNLPKKQNVLAQVGQQVCQKSYGYKLPTLPDRSMAGELSFPSAEECDSNVTPTRHVTVPVTFENVTQYRQVFKAALREHLNIVLFELARAYYTALNKVDVSWFGTHEQGSHQRSDGPSCPHGQARLRAVKKEGPNKGRLFFSCPGTGQAQCKFFKWADEYQTNKAGLRDTGHISANKLALSSAESVMDFLRSHNVAFYCECHLMKKHTDSSKRRTFSAKAKKWGGQSSGGVWDKKKGLYLELPRKDHSSAYSKDDIWIISKNLSFNKESTFIASSTYYGPSSSGELEILPISGYSPSNWQSGETVHALMACNAGTELSCINNIEEHVKMQNMPVLPHILHRVQTLEALNTSRTSSFVPPVLRASCCQLDLPSEVTEGLAEEMIARFNLNKDQAAALHSCARMFISSVDHDSTSLPVCLIHGAFGAGKSYLLAVIVLYLVELFRVSESLNHQSNAPTEKKILVSSTTNVAVDRILLGLLELGFEEFVRVGSIRKIAKPVLPYSVHSTGSDSQELKELQALLKGELTPSERTHVRKSIERHKLGKNKKKLSHVRVVGVTCAACVFPYLDKLKFSVLLLDECSQMTEPASLLPMARFECQKLVLVGDPKQLSPTIQGSEPEHEAGLEQTLFDRLMKMGYEATLLRTQYRCHPAISALSNRLFYDNKLLDGVAAEDRSPVVDLVPTLCFYNVATGKEKRASDGSYYNEAEAKFVVFLIECLLESGVEPAQMGVITLYKSQLHTVANNLTASRASSHSELKTIQISTVDAFQGGEKDIIILSCVRTDHIGFIDCDRRTNVALTRAKRHLLIVGHLKMLSCNSLWGRVIEHCRDSPDGLCNSQEFIKKWQQQESTALNKAAVPVQVTEQAKQTSDARDQHTSEILPDLSATTCSEETERQVAHSSKSGFCSDTMDINCSHGDYDSDIELPTFDLVSSLGI